MKEEQVRVWVDNNLVKEVKRRLPLQTDTLRSKSLKDRENPVILNPVKFYTDSGGWDWHFRVWTESWNLLKHDGPRCICYCISPVIEREKESDGTKYPSRDVLVHIPGSEAGFIEFSGFKEGSDFHEIGIDFLRFGPREDCYTDTGEAHHDS